MSIPASDRGGLTPGIVRLFYLLSPVVFGAIALAILWARGLAFLAPFLAPTSPVEQILAGLIAGIGTGIVIGIVVVRAAWLESLRAMIRQGFESARPTLFDLFMTSLSAGVSEEFLFRGAVQPWLGIWVTSLLFAVAHGSGVRFSRGHLLFGLFIFSASVFLGGIYLYFGLIASMITHAVLDFVLLIQYRWMVEGQPADPAVQS